MSLLTLYARTARLRLSNGRRAAMLLLVFALSALLLCMPEIAGHRGTRQVHAAAVQPVVLKNPDERCAGCHAAIYRTYEQTSMARGSGVAEEALTAGGFTHKSSGVAFRVDRNEGLARLRYERPAGAEGAKLVGEERLRYFIGSGKRGRTYLFARPLANSDVSLWFEAPINWYTRRAAYDMAPAFDNAVSAPLALPVEPNCLHCHATEIAEPLTSARNAFQGAPFQQGGIGCSACHGDASAHMRSGGKTAMLRLASLAPIRRDSVCLQCHLEGDAMVQRSGRSLARFQPGESLWDTAVYFVKASAPDSMLRASSQYEALLRSACRRGAGEQLTCVTCHDPHSTPAPAEKVAYFRGKCLQCHADSATFVAARHHPEQPDCATCHMPTRKTADISHEQTVDHDIEAKPSTPGLAARSLLLQPVGAVVPGDRERGLAYAQFAARGDRVAYTRATSLLRKAEFQGVDDAVLHEQLGFLAQLKGDLTEAKSEYGKALIQDANDAAMLTDLAVLEVQIGDREHAEEHLRTVVEHDPSQTAAVLNLALLRCKSGGVAEAATLLRTALHYNPDSPEARRFSLTGDYGGAHCAIH